MGKDNILNVLGTSARSHSEVLSNRIAYGLVRVVNGVKNEAQLELTKVVCVEWISGCPTKTLTRRSKEVTPPSPSHVVHQLKGRIEYVTYNAN